MAILAEECAEVIKEVGKILRHGYESTHPSGGPTNRESLETELGHVIAIANRMNESGDTDWSKVLAAADDKEVRLDKYTHHQVARIT